MRTVLYSALSVVTFGLLIVAPASAATHWKCMGSYVACGSAKSAPARSTYNTRATRSSYAQRSRSGRKASNSRRSNTRVASIGTKSAGRSGQTGIASYYWQGQQTASGARFNPNGMTAAHRSLPFGTKVRVTNKRNGRSVVVTINDRGPFVGGRVIDLSRGAAQVIGMTGAGLAPVSLDVLG